jgi:hypothetical protein
MDYKAASMLRKKYVLKLQNISIPGKNVLNDFKQKFDTLQKPNKKFSVKDLSGIIKQKKKT